MVFLGSFLAELAGLEPIVGAFLAGLALNRFIPHASALMNRIEFVGNAFFIPFFLISVGMLVDVSVLFKGFGALKVAGVMIVLGILSKYIAAWLTQKTFRLSQLEQKMIFGLSTARVGATLAVVLVGYNIIIGELPSGEPIRLLNEDVLNGTIIMILVTCTVSSFIVEKAAQRIALDDDTVKTGSAGETGNILISLAYPDTVTELVYFGLLLKPSGSAIPIYALNVVSDESDSGVTKATAKKMMDKAVNHAAATEHAIIPVVRFDASISNGIIYTLKEQNITDLLIGLHHQAKQDSFLGPVAERILKHTSETVFIYKSVQPLNTLKRMLVVVTPKAELEPGFSHWFGKLLTIGKAVGLNMKFCGCEETLKELEDLLNAQNTEIEISFSAFSNWDDFLIFSREVKNDDLFVIVSSRKGHVSHQQALEKLPYILSNYFTATSFIMLYPQQLEKSTLI
jgi:hypothetical protein